MARGPDATSASNDYHLRSSSAVIGHHIEANDGEIGHIKDLLVDDSTWAIRYLIVNTRNWWSGHRVLVAPHWIKEASWSEDKVSVDLPREAVKDMPSFESLAQFDPHPEEGIHGYGRRARVDETGERRSG